jgi:hypothetical protein
MLKNLSMDYNLRGYSFEYIAKILLRRTNKNNFIFQLAQFDSIEEILTKYRFRYDENINQILEILRTDWNRCDLIEFEIDDNFNRNIKQIILYEVKTKFYKVDRDYFEFCTSNFKFMDKCTKENIPTKIISIVLFENWRFSFNLFEFSAVKKKIYSNFKKAL